jgi:histone acetyltransferase HTATIP
MQESILTQLQYNLEKVKRKVSDALVDRLAFIKDPMMIVDIATNIHHHEFPYIDHGLRRAILAHIDARLPGIIEDEGAWEELAKDTTVLRALHMYQCELRSDAGRATSTPPLTPVKEVKKQKA